MLHEYGARTGTNLGTIRGTVTDANGAVIPNASVKITDKGTGLSRDLTTNGEGNYVAAALKSGTYEGRCSCHRLQKDSCGDCAQWL